MTAIAVASACSGAAMAGCGSHDEQSADEQSATDESALTATFSGTAIDGGAEDEVIVSVPRVHIDPLTQQPVFHTLQVGPNYHPIYGCDIEQLNEAIEQPLNSPTPVALDYPEEGQARGRLSCADDDAGGFPLESTPFWAAEDPARPGMQRYFFPTGAAGEYYSFIDDNDCLGPLKSRLLKLDRRLSEYFFMESFGRPEDLTSEIKLQCGETSQGSNKPFRLYAGQDCTLPGVVGQCRPGRSNVSATFIIIEANLHGTTTYLPVYRVNGQPVGVNTPGLAALQKWLGIPADTALLGLPSFDRDNRTFWDLCLPMPASADAGAEPSDAAAAPQCTFNHYHHPSTTSAAPTDTADAAAPTRPVSYRTLLELEGATYQEAVDTKPWVSPAFENCEGTLEDTFGLRRDSAAVDARAWVNDRMRALQMPAATPARFRCPPRNRAADGSDASVCKIALGDAQVSERRQVMTLRTLNARIAAAAAACASPRLDTLEITLRSPLDVTLSAMAGLSFDRFRNVSIVGAAGQRKEILFHEQCTDANPCLRTNFSRTRSLVTLTPDVPTRSLTLDHIDLGYVAEDFTTPKDAASEFFDLGVLLIRAEGTATDHVRIVLTDASAGRDPAGDARKFVSQAVTTKFGDLFVVRSTLGGTKDPTSFWKTVGITDSLVVLTGTKLGRADSPSSVTGEGGGIRLSDGRNDLFAVNALVQGPVVSNAISRSVFVDSTLKRSKDKEAIHFVGAETVGVPPGFHMFFQGASRVTQMQHLTARSDASAFAIFESTVLPTIQMAGTVKYFDDDGTAAIAPSTLVADATKFCSPEGKGTLRLLDATLRSPLVCKPGPAVTP